MAQRAGLMGDAGSCPQAEADTVPCCTGEQGWESSKQELLGCLLPRFAQQPRATPFILCHVAETWSLRSHGM